MFARTCRHTAVAAAVLAAILVVVAWFDATIDGVRVTTPVYSVGALFVLVLLFPIANRWVVRSTIQCELAEAYALGVRATDRRVGELREELVATLGALVTVKIDEGANRVTRALQQNTDAVMRQVLISQMPAGKDATPVCDSGGQVLSMRDLRGH